MRLLGKQCGNQGRWKHVIDSEKCPHHNRGLSDHFGSQKRSLVYIKRAGTIQFWTLWVPLLRPHEARQGSLFGNQAWTLTFNMLNTTVIYIDLVYINDAFITTLIIYRISHQDVLGIHRSFYSMTNTLLNLTFPLSICSYASFAFSIGNVSILHSTPCNCAKSIASSQSSA